MHHFVAVAASLVMPTITGNEATQLILRWFHFHRRHHLDRPALFLQPGQRPVHEAGGRRREAQNFSEPDSARPELVPLERAGHGLCRLLVLGTISSRTRRAAPGRRRGQHDRLLSAALDRGLGHSLPRDQEDDAQRIRPRRHHCDPGLRRGMDVRELHAGRRRRQPRALRSASAADSAS